jgi:hypothetical protein
MTIGVIDILWGGMQGYFGSALFVIIIVLAILLFLLWLSRLPIYFIFLFAAPALLGLTSSYGWIGMFMWILIGLIFAMLAIRLFTDQTGIW